MRRVYIVEDDADIRDIVIYALKAREFEAVGFDRGELLFGELAGDSGLPDLCILDVMLPDDDGLTILQKLREYPKTRHIPIIMLTAKFSEQTKVKCLDMGADDYITKPFGVMELISRINAVLRRTSAKTNEQPFEYKKLYIDKASRTVYVSGEKIALTYKEYELLLYLSINKGLVLTRDKVIEAVWGIDFEPDSRTVDTHIRTIRQKLGEAGDYLKTVRSVGYKLGEN